MASSALVQCLSTQFHDDDDGPRDHRQIRGHHQVVSDKRIPKFSISLASHVKEHLGEIFKYPRQKMHSLSNRRNPQRKQDRPGARIRRNLFCLCDAMHLY